MVQGQILPPLKDQKDLENSFVSHCGSIQNKYIKAVYCFKGLDGKGDKIYLQKTDDSLESLKIPDELLETHLTIVQSGPKFFVVETQDGIKYSYYFQGIYKDRFVKEIKKKMRGHDNVGPIAE